MELVRRGKLREEYSLLLLLISSIVLFLSISSEALDRTADLLGISYKPTLFVSMAFLVVFAVQIAQGVIVSSLSLRSRDLAQKVAELEWYLCQLRNHAQVLEEQQNGSIATWMKTTCEMLTSAEGSEEGLAT